MKMSKSDNLSAHGPSHFALLGSGWVSRKSPAIFCEMPALANSKTYCPLPPVLFSNIPGCCKECVTSKNTGFPRSFKI